MVDDQRTTDCRTGPLAGTEPETGEQGKMPDLLPCPFCGSTDLIAKLHGTTDDAPIAITCSNDDCETVGPYGTSGDGCYRKSLIDASKQWNRRAGPSSPSPQKGE